MIISGSGLAVLAGLLLVGGLCCLLVRLAPANPRLADVLLGLSVVSSPWDDTTTDAEPSGRSERLGAWLARRSPQPVTVAQRRQLRLRGSGVAEHYADKAVWAVIGLVLPTVLAGCLAVATGAVGPAVPGLVALVGLVLGWFVPDLLLLRGTQRRRQDAAHALLTFIDLVTLERLANASSTQALHNAAGVSALPLFGAIRAALERARLEQQPPYAELRRLADQLDLPQLGDLVDVLTLDDSGASLAPALRARVRELRDAHLATEQREANAVSESLAVYMAIPALIFGLIFMAPPLLRLLGS